MERKPIGLSVPYRPAAGWRKRQDAKQWVGLTDEDIKQLGLSNYTQAIREAEAKLKQKNTK